MTQKLPGMNPMRSAAGLHKPWLLREDIIEPSSSLANCLDRLTEIEAAEDARIQKLYAELNDEVYRLYGIPDSLATGD